MHNLSQTTLCLKFPCSIIMIDSFYKISYQSTISDNTYKVYEERYIFLTEEVKRNILHTGIELKRIFFPFITIAFKFMLKK